MDWTPEKEQEAEKLLDRIKKQDPNAELRIELGMLLMKPKSSFTDAELKRYNELSEILKD